VVAAALQEPALLVLEMLNLEVVLVAAEETQTPLELVVAVLFGAVGVVVLAAE
jgi:hypothetical protein